MRLSVGAVVPAVLALVFVAGCGSSPSYTDSASSAVKTLENAVAAYNASKPADVAATGRACLSAYHSIAGNAPPAPPSSLGKKLTEEAGALTLAYKYARLGFSHCAAGASSGDYSLMARADSELAHANLEIARARSLA